MIPDSPTRVRETLAELGVVPRRKLGQNFLADANLRDAVVAAGGSGEGDLVLEVGPGLGILTKGLLATGATVVAAEIDPVLADFLEEEFAEEARFTLVRGDAIVKKGLAPDLEAALAVRRPAARRFLLVANLPYAVSTVLLAVLARRPDMPDRIVVMVQKEVAERMAAGPGGGDYGPLAVLLSLRGDVRILREVGGRVFQPPAPVRSAVVEVVRKDVDPADLEAGDRAARLAFLHRRKSLKRALEAGGAPPESIERAIAAAGAAPADRPEVLTPAQYVRLGHVLFSPPAPRSPAGA